MHRSLSGMGAARHGGCVCGGHECRLVYDARCVGVVAAVGRDYPSGTVVRTAGMAVVSTVGRDYRHA